MTTPTPKRAVRVDVTDVLGVLSCVMVADGFCRINPAAGFIVGGILLVAIAVLIEIRRGKT